MSPACRICGNRESNAAFQLHEMMYRSYEAFEYLRCGRCGCLQIKDIPADLDRHYPPSYYSFDANSGSDLIRRVRAAAIRHHSGHRSLVGALSAAVGQVPSDAVWLRVCRPKLTSRILDVGCGYGARLREFAIAGFQNLAGVDPFVPRDLPIAPGVVVRRGEIGSIQAEFDLIMFHHSLEHVTDPAQTIRLAERLLAPDGCLLIRVPVMDKWAWKHFGADWVQLDPPRHLFQFTEESMRQMAAAAGLEVGPVIYDSFELQFIGSERARLHRTTGAQFKVSRSQLRRYQRQAAELNARHDGDQACFILKRPVIRAG